MISSVYDFVSRLVGHVWQYTGQSVNYSEQPYLYFTSCLIVLLIVIVTIDLLYRILGALFNFRL